MEAGAVARVGVVGMGYVGLPLALTFVERGVEVVGVDIDPAKLVALQERRSYLQHIPAARIGAAMDTGRFSVTTDFSALRSCTAVIICVPTPLTKEREPDLTCVESAARGVAPHVQRGQMVSLESTTYPGTTREVVQPILEQGCGLKAGDDFALVFSPEREDPGNPHFDTRTIPKVVGGMTTNCLERGIAVYSKAVDRVVPVTSLETAEMTKILENTYRAVNIALVNELKMLFDRMGIDVWDVIEAAKTKPFGYQPFYPGPGLGGHCIPIDPFYLSWKAREYKMRTRFIELAGEINTRMPDYVVSRVMETLNERGKALRGARVLVLGLAYKKDVDDVRESPSVTLIELLQERGALVDYHDPHIPVAKPMREHNLTHMKSVPLTKTQLKRYDCVLIATDHSTVDYDLVCRHAALVVDTRNATARKKRPAKRVVKA